MTGSIRRIGAMTALVALSAGAAFGAPDARAIMTRATNTIKSASTYQGEWLVTTSMGTMGSMTVKMNMKTTRSGQARVEMTPTGKATGMMAAAANMAASTTVSDGKTMLMYMKGMNSYMKMPVPKGHNPGFAGMLGDLTKSGVRASYVGEEMVRGRRCQVIKITPPNNGKNGSQGAKMDMRAYVDKATGSVRQVKTVTVMPGGMPGGPQPSKDAKPQSVTITNTMTLVSEKLNAPISPSVFKFKPPAGAKEMSPGMMPGGGPAPGGRPR